MDIFDILGPVMVGPSSSHTAGAVRIGLMARTLLGTEPVRANIHLHGSFAETGMGHGTDKALVAGLLGIFLGCFGVHNFYLGYTGKAVAQVLISVLSCFALSLVSGVWGLIEGILILCGNINKDAKGNLLGE